MMHYFTYLHCLSVTVKILWILMARDLLERIVAALECQQSKNSFMIASKYCIFGRNIVHRICRGGARGKTITGLVIWSIIIGLDKETF